MRRGNTLRTLLWASAFYVAVAAGAAAQTFEERLSLCLGCHGEKGQSETPEVPSLGAQLPQYTVIQLFMFRQGLRKVEPMTEMAKGLTDAELQKFADTIAKLPAPPPAEGGDEARMARGRELATQHRCNFCHGGNFAGADSVPRVSAQREDYLLKSLTDYKSGTRYEYQPVMAEVMRALPEQDIADLAHLLAHTK